MIVPPRQGRDRGPGNGLVRVRVLPGRALVRAGTARWFAS